jgi:hypothetical protein
LGGNTEPFIELKAGNLKGVGLGEFMRGEKFDRSSEVLLELMGEAKPRIDVVCPECVPSKLSIRF